MPAAAVIPAPIVYIRVVAVEALVVGFWSSWIGRPQGLHWLSCSFLLKNWHALYRVCQGSRTFTLKKLECSKQAYRLNTLAWNNKIGLSVLFCWFLELK